MTLLMTIAACVLFTLFVLLVWLFIKSVYAMGRMRESDPTGPIVSAVLALAFLFFWLLLLHNVYWIFL